MASGEHFCPSNASLGMELNSASDILYCGFVPQKKSRNSRHGPKKKIQTSNSCSTRCNLPQAESVSYRARQGFESIWKCVLSAFIKNPKRVYISGATSRRREKSQNRKARPIKAQERRKCSKYLQDLVLRLCRDSNKICDNFSPTTNGELRLRQLQLRENLGMGEEEG